MKPPSPRPRALPIADFAHQGAWAEWLEQHHATSPGLWLRLAKKGSGLSSVSYVEAVETALCFGWIDGQKDRHDDRAWLQKFTPRGPRSLWSKINRERVAVLVESGRMRAAGLEAVERGKRGGQWEAAYDSPAGAAVPPDLQAELDRSEAAAVFFGALDGANRYAILWRIQTAKKAETRARRIRDLVAMLARREKLHP